MMSQEFSTEQTIKGLQQTNVCLPKTYYTLIMFIGPEDLWIGSETGATARTGMASEFAVYVAPVLAEEGNEEEEAKMERFKAKMLEAYPGVAVHKVRTDAFLKLPPAMGQVQKQTGREDIDSLFASYAKQYVDDRTKMMDRIHNVHREIERDTERLKRSYAPLVELLTADHDEEQEEAIGAGKEPTARPRKAVRHGTRASKDKMRAQLRRQLQDRKNKENEG